MSYNIVGYFIFTIITSFTPGPNNLMLFSYGKAYGMKNSGKVMLGIFLGFLFECVFSGYGIDGILLANPSAGLILRIVGSVWMLYLGWMLRTMNIHAGHREKPVIGFGKAFGQQFLNPKAWIMAIGGASAFMPQLGSIHLNAAVYGLSFAMIGIPSMVAWLKAGDVLARFITTERHHVVLGYVLFGLMIVTTITIWI
ncbi:MAG TPA: LysE family translocator [Bacteroidota bacterium]|nr:LysE family translocator [Bacteroidota bacterium]